MSPRKTDSTKKSTTKQKPAETGKKTMAKKPAAQAKKAPEAAAKKTSATAGKKAAALAATKTPPKKEKPMAQKAGAVTQTAKAAGKARVGKSKKQMASTEKGDRLYCTVCGIVITVDEECGCESCDVICCGEPMQAKR